MVLLVEELLDKLERALKKKDLSLIVECLNLRGYLDDPLLEDPLAKDWLDKLFEYIEPIFTLPEKRKNYRLEKSIQLVEKYRIRFFLSKPECKNVKDPSAKIAYAKGVGPARAKTLRKLGLETIGDLIYYLPRDYEDRRKIYPIKDLKDGMKVTTKGKILSIDRKKTRGMKIISAVLNDNLDSVILKWFNIDYIYEQLKRLKGKDVLVTGTVKRGYFGNLEMLFPEVVEDDGKTKREILPIYRLTSGITQKSMRRIFKENISVICNIKDDFPKFLVEKRNLIDKTTALYGMHFPKTFYHLNRSKERLSYEELFYFQVALAMTRKKKLQIGGISKKIKGELAEKFLESLPFKLTNAQKRVHSEIREDMKSSKPMNRLLQGDVGSGKTVVAQLALIDNYEAGFQGAMMAPTLILALQHYNKMKALEKLGINVALITGSTSASQKKNIKAALKNGMIDVVIGTHALIQEDVHFSNLGLVIIDEQHRFGVRQREALMSKGKLVDTLVMTATPIPRTLSLTLYGDLDVSIIDEMPPGRRPVKTMMVPVSKIDDVYEFIKEEVKQGHQAFIVYPLVEESEKLLLKSAKEMYEYLSEEVFPDLKVGLLHGKMPDSQKEEVMREFSEGKYDILVSTTVIEVGIDVPNATVMVIENPERFGLAQLHQLRGRVGRSKYQAYCFLIYGDVDMDTYERLRFFESTTDGFKIAEYDLKLRGPGEFLGTRQHGMPEFKFADIVRDSEILRKARIDAFELVNNDPNMEKYKQIYSKVLSLYGEKIKLLEVS